MNLKKQRMEVLLPDDTTIIAESDQQSGYPGINIYHEDVTGDRDEVAFVEYNPENDIGRKLMVGVYRNDEDDTKYYQAFRHVFKPSFSELNYVYDEIEENEFRIVCNDFIEIVNVSNDLVIYRDFNYDDDKLKFHAGHKIVLAAYGGENGLENISVECEDCNEVLYSVDRKKLLPDLYRVVKPKSRQYITQFATDNKELKEHGCIFCEKISLDNEHSAEFECKREDDTLGTEELSKVYIELVEEYLRYSIFKNAKRIKKYCDESVFFVKTDDDHYVTQIVTNDYTFFIRLVPNEGSADAYIYAYVNEILYNKIEPVKLPATADIDCEAMISCVKHLDNYKNPQIGYLDYVENECWQLFKEYAKFVGVEIGDGIDFSIVKEISEKFINVVEKTFGIEFPMSKRG